MGLLQFLHNKTFNFTKKRSYAYAFSLFLLLITIVALFVRHGIPLGVDFQGGTLIQVQFSQPVSPDTLRKALTTKDMQDVSLQTLNDNTQEYLIRFSSEKRITQDSITTLFQQKIPNTPYTIERFEGVGSKVSSTMRSNALEALYYAILIIAIYISGRFENKWFTSIGIGIIFSLLFFTFSSFHISLAILLPILIVATLALLAYVKCSFAFAAIIALIHDVLITVGILVLCNISFDLTIVSALLAIIGYSLNDTIIVFDRIRENIHLANKKNFVLENIINTSISTTLSRTILTSATTLIVLVALLIFGGPILFPFALTLFIGIIVGTYSSIFVASPLLLFFNLADIKNTLTKQTIKIDENGVV